MAKFLNGRQNLRAVWKLGFFAATLYGLYCVVFYYPGFVFSLPQPNGKNDSILFRGSQATTLGLQSGMVGHLEIPESDTVALAPFIEASRVIPPFVKALFREKIAAAQYKYYENNFSESSVETRGMGSLQVVKTEKVPGAYRVSLLCNPSTSGSGVLEASVKKDGEIQRADSFAIKCLKANQVRVTFQKVGESERDVESNTASLPHAIRIHEEVEVFFWLRHKNSDEEILLSGDEGIALADTITPVSLVSSGTAPVECPGKPAETCHVPVARLKANAEGASPAIMVGDTRVVLPLQILPQTTALTRTPNKE